MSCEHCADAYNEGVGAMMPEVERLRAYRELWLVEKRELADRIWRLTNLPFTDDDRRAIQHEALKAAGEADAALREVSNG